MNKSLKGRGNVLLSLMNPGTIGTVITCRQLWVEEKQVLCSRLEECQHHQQALSEQLTDASDTTKKVRTKL